MSWPDIETVSLVEETPPRVRGLRRFSERLAASRFFGGHDPFWSASPDTQSAPQHSWLAWASIVALPGAAKGDPLHLDLLDAGFGDAWLDSGERRAVYEDPLLAVLFELRNYEVHVELRPCERRDFEAVVGFGADPGVEPRRLEPAPYSFITPVEYESLCQLENLSRGRSKVTSGMIEWFNRQAVSWPLPYLVGTGRQRYIARVGTFLDRLPE